MQMCTAASPDYLKKHGTPSEIEALATHQCVRVRLPTSGGVLPYWLGAAFINLLSPWVDPAVAARLPFAMLLAAVLALTWYTTYHLARTDAAQPLPLAFGGEAAPADYARAVADGGLLALIASLGLLQLGHETTPELLQLTGSTLFLFSLAVAQVHPVKARWAALLSLPVMAASGSPAVAVMLGLVGGAICLLSRQDVMRQHLRWVAASTTSMPVISPLSRIGVSTAAGQIASTPMLCAAASGGAQQDVPQAVA